MKNQKLTTILSLLIACVIGLSLSAPVFANEPSVSYEGGAEKFVVLSGDNGPTTDLFENYKAVMPGDSLIQKIRISNDYAGKVRIYMRADPHDEGANPLSSSVAQTETVASMEEFLSQLSMTVWHGATVIYQASPDQLDGLKENVLLGEFASGQESELTVELKMPIELGIEYANRMGEVDWIFVAEEITEPVPTPGETPYILPAVLLLLAGVAVLVIVILIRRKKDKTE